MLRRTFAIVGQQFKTKKELETAVRAIVARYRDREVLNDQDLAFMLDLLKLHPDYEQKIGVGVKRMWVQTNRQIGSTRGFWIERADGTTTDVSWTQCLKPQSKLRDFKAAGRRAIHQTVEEFKYRFFADNPAPRCPILGTPLSYESSVVDHVYPFELLITEYIQARGIDVETAPFMGSHDGKIGQYFASDELESDWLAFHNARAVLRVVSEEGHKSNASNTRVLIECLS